MSDIWMDDHQKIGVLSCRTVTGIYAPHFFQMQFLKPESLTDFEEYFEESNHDPRTL